MGSRSSRVKMAAPLTLVLILAVTIRAVLFRSSLATLIADRVEVASPLNSWKRGMSCYQQMFIHLHDESFEQHILAEMSASRCKLAGDLSL